MFQVLESALVENPFKKLVSETTFKEITHGRNVATFVEPIEGKIPIVRTTSIYKNPPQTFNELHREIVKGLDQKFNNAMLELYDTTYKTMKFHTDQSLDLEDKSYIAIYSCYPDPSQPNRMLTIYNKKTEHFLWTPNYVDINFQPACYPKFFQNAYEEHQRNVLKFTQYHCNLYELVSEPGFQS
jgi:hypothetical protein